MPRLPRIEVPGIPLHVTHRGVNRCAVFVDDVDRGTYLHLLDRQFRKRAVSMHAYVLMGDHVHLLLSAPDVGIISRAMQNAVQCYVRGFNQRHGRTGTLWEGRFRSCLVQTDSYLLSVIRYIELNPVRAGLVADPSAFRWSSVHAHLGGRMDSCVTQHPVFVALGPDRRSRAEHYREWIMQTIGDIELADIRRHLHQQRALADPRFQSMLERTLDRHVRCRNGGRPVGRKRR
ncbi:MAG TPA: transposase [Xanthomonadales bacterium]|nr:transposase [Xanthomonadales bacterium]